MIVLLFCDVVNLPQLPRLVANQSHSFLVGFFGMYTLSVVASVCGMIPLALLRKQVHAFLRAFCAMPRTSHG
jgi:threonine/homoserine/homoserine lactone efflux protein